MRSVTIILLALVITHFSTTNQLIIPVFLRINIRKDKSILVVKQQKSQDVIKLIKANPRHCTGSSVLTTEDTEWYREYLVNSNLPIV